MKKTLLATAIAGALGASAAAQAATVYNQDGTQLDIYGNIQIAYKSIDAGSSTEDEVFDNGSTVGFSGQHIINPGLTGYFKAEFEHQADEEKIRGGLDGGDQAYLGLKGNFGDVRLGSWDPLIDDWIQDPISNNEYFDVSDSNSGINKVGSDDREGDKLQYMSPVMGGFQFALGTQYKGDGDETEFGGYSFDPADGSVDNSNYSVDRDNDASFFGGLKYAVGAFSIAAAYDNLGIYDGTVTEAGADSGLVAGEDYDAGDQYGVTAQYTIGTLRMAAKVERFDGDESDTDADFYALGARWGYGYGDLYGAYQYIDAEENSYVVEGDDDSFNEVILGATYNISPAMYTFIEGAMYDQDSDIGDGVAVGAVYSF
ncbi:porin [Salinicola sp. MIT1003]|uniref:porin n=1 Tax=Salinicola sp. MIT1003 TaxID=1882734 RepID=UPI0008DDCE48|nr:porin [Salinicola sp. MIT1003]OHY98700.1 porin [Salinicola sp. MIT1003]